MPPGHGSGIDVWARTMTSPSSETIAPSRVADGRTEASAVPAIAILASLSLAHLLNDLVQSLLAAIYPLLKDEFRLDFGQIGLITLVFQLPPRCCNRSSGCTPIAVRCRSRWRSAWASRSSASSCSPWPGPTACCSSPPASSGSARRSSIRKRRGWHGSRRAGVTGSRNPSSRSAAMRHGARAVAGGVHRRAARPGEPRLVLALSRSSASVVLTCGRALVPGASSHEAVAIATEPARRRRQTLSRGRIVSRSASCWA